jgi:hypothetical protein
MFSVSRYGDALFGFQLAWYMVLLAFVGAVFVLDRSKVGWPVFGLGIAIAIIGSYSSLQGLLIWPVGLIVLLWRHTARSVVLSWIGAAVGTTAVYFIDFDFSYTSGNSSYLRAHPLAVAEFFFVSIGDVMAQPLHAHASNLELVVLGVAIVLLALTCLALYARPGHLATSPIGPVLICFGLLFAATVAYGRAQQGILAADQTRYATFNLLILVGSYLCLVERLPVPSAAQSSDWMGFLLGNRRSPTANRTQMALFGLRVLLAFLIVFEVTSVVLNGFAGGAATRVVMTEAQLIAAHPRDASNSQLEKYLLPNPYIEYGQIRTLDELAQAHHLSFFATAEAARLARTKLPAYNFTPQRTRVAKPASGAVVSGTAFLVAVASSDFVVSTVEFQIRGPGAVRPIVIPAKHVLFGWLGAWSSTEVANGNYTIQSLTRDSTGHLGESRPGSVKADN